MGKRGSGCASGVRESKLFQEPFLFWVLGFFRARRCGDTKGPFSGFTAVQEASAGLTDLLYTLTLSLLHTHTHTVFSRGHVMTTSFPFL